MKVATEHNEIKKNPCHRIRRVRTIVLRFRNTSYDKRFGGSSSSNLKMDFSQEDALFGRADKPQSMPLVDLMVSNNMADERAKVAVKKSPQQRSVQAPPVRAAASAAAAAATPRLVLRPDDSQVAPEPGAISEQPELSHVRRMKDEMDMYRHNAKSGVAFASQSERYSGSQGQRARHETRRRQKLSGRRASKHGRQQQHSSHTGNASSTHSSSYYDSDESATTSNTTDKRYKKSSRSGRVHGSKSRSPHGSDNEILKRQVDKAIRSDNENGISTDAQQYGSLNGDVQQQTNGGNQALKNVGATGGALSGSTGSTGAVAAAADAGGAKSSKIDSFKRFFSQNIMLIVASIVMLILVGIGVYLLFKGNRETVKRAQERVQQSALLEEEQAMPGRDVVLQELQQKNEALAAANAQSAQLFQAYEAQMEQFRAQNELQMQAIEKINSEKAMYEQAVAEWEQYGQLLQQQQQQQHQQQQQQQQRAEERADKRFGEPAEQTAVEQEAEPTPNVVAEPVILSDVLATTQAQWLSDADGDDSRLQQQYSAAQTPPPSELTAKVTTTPQNLQPPIENRRQPPLMLLPEVETDRVQQADETNSQQLSSQQQESTSLEHVLLTTN